MPREIDSRNDKERYFRISFIRMTPRERRAWILQKSTPAWNNRNFIIILFYLLFYFIRYYFWNIRALHLCLMECTDCFNALRFI